MHDILCTCDRCASSSPCENKSEVDILREKVRLLELQEEGAKEAFGHVVQAKKDLKKRVLHLESLLASAYKKIRDLSTANPQAQTL